jgi:hypothetical protein
MAGDAEMIVLGV